jgi:hypothetical protein
MQGVEVTKVEIQRASGIGSNGGTCWIMVCACGHKLNRGEGRLITSRRCSKYTYKLQLIAKADQIPLYKGF